MLLLPKRRQSAAQERPEFRDVATLRDVINRLAVLAAEGDREAKLQISAINTVARASGCAPDDLPTDPARLRRHLETMSAAMAGLTTGSWRSVRSRILRAMQRVEVRVMPGRRTKPLSPEWAVLYEALFAAGKKAELGRFIGYLSDRGVSPHEVSDEHLERFAYELHTSSLRGRPQTIVRGAIRSWNEAVESIPDWPQQQLTTPEREKKGYVLPVTEFSAEFQKSLTDYLAFLADPPDDDNAPLHGLRPVTLRLREFQFRQMGSAIVRQGVPIGDLSSLGDLATRENVNRVCDFFIEHHGRPDSSQLEGLLRLLGSIAKHHLDDRALAEWIGRRAKRLLGRSRPAGMTEKNRRRLAVFNDPKLIRDLLLLPYSLLKRTEAGKLAPRDAARLVQAAVAIELEIMCPIRLQNLAGINVDTDFVRGRTGKNSSVHLFIPGNRTKNGEEIELELPSQTMALIDLYLIKYRNDLIDPAHRGKGPRYLFPRSDGTAKVGKFLASAICHVMLKELGTRFNMHLFRHLGCFLYLRSHPGQMDVMRRVLGHRDVATTMKFYAFVQQSEAFRLFDAHVLQLRDEALRPTRRSIDPRKGARR